MLSTTHSAKKIGSRVYSALSPLQQGVLHLETRGIEGLRVGEWSCFMHGLKFVLVQTRSYGQGTYADIICPFL